MNFRLIVPAAVIALVAVARAAGPDNPQTAATGGSGSFSNTKARIESLFQDRDHSPALPGNIINPFIPSSMRRTGSDANKVSSAPTDVLSDSAMLERVAPAIQIQGIIQAGGHPSLIINRKPFAVGDHLTVLYGDIPVVVVIKKITRETFTLGYRAATLTLSLPR